MRWANDELMVIAMVETVSALDDLDAIAAIDGIDVLWIGHFDLTASMGIAGQFDHPRYADGAAAGRRRLRAQRQGRRHLDRRRRCTPSRSPARASASSPSATTSSCCATRCSSGSPTSAPSLPTRREAPDMPKQPLHSDQAGPPLGAYSQGIRAGDFIFVSGCGPIDAQTAQVRGETVAEQTDVVLDNVTAILAAGGAGLQGRRQGDRPPRGRDDVPGVQRRLLGAHARAAAGPHDGRQRAAPGRPECASRSTSSRTSAHE